MVFCKLFILISSYTNFYFHCLYRKGLDDTKPLAIIKLFFKARFAQATETDIIGDWVVLLSIYLKEILQLFVGV